LSFLAEVPLLLCCRTSPDLTTLPDHRASLTRDIRAHAEALVSFLLRAVSAD
jgi:hypothetical protein